MLQANLIQTGEFLIEEVNIPKVEPNQVLIEVKIAGICGSDLHTFLGKHPFVKPPIVLGHEFSGTIKKLGSNLERSQFSIGQRVTIEPSITCGKCYNCSIGRYNICEVLQVIGSQINGGYAHYVAVPASNLISLSNDLSFEDGAMMEPLAVAVHASNIGKIEINDSVLIIGAGTIGLLLAQVAKAKGAKVVVSDIIDSRLELARKLGVDDCINSNKVDLQQELLNFYPNGADIIFECVGVPFTLQQSIEIARKGSRIVIVGVPEGSCSIPVHFIQDRELEVLGDLMYTRSDFETGIELVKSQKVILDDLKTKTFTLERINEAFKYVIDNPANTLKVFLEVSK